MATVQDSQKCSVCGGMMVCLFNSRTTEEDRFCLRCGTREEFFLLKDEDGNYVKKDGKFIIDYKKTKGYGAYAITSKDGHGQTGCFDKPITEEDIERFKEILADDDIDENQSFLTKWENGQVTVLAGNSNEDHLLSYDELTEKWKKEAEELNKVDVAGFEDYEKDNLSMRLCNYILEKVDHAKDFRITDIAIVGSRVKGTHREDSDVDVAFEYDGEYRPDNVLEALNSEPLVIDGIKVDFVPYALYKGEKMNYEEPMEKLCIYYPSDELTFD